PLLNRTVIVENKPGAIGNIATEYVARSKPDGHTIYIHGASALAANMHMFKHPSVDAGTAIQVAATINKQPTMFVVHVSKPWTSVAEVTAYAKDRKEKRPTRHPTRSARPWGQSTSSRPACRRWKSITAPHRIRSTTWRAALSTTRCSTTCLRPRRRAK